MQFTRKKRRTPVQAVAPTMTRSQASLSGAEGDGKDHDLAYWLDSGFLTLPKDPGRTGM